MKIRENIRLLMVEDILVDFLLVNAVLRKDGFTVQSKRVESEAEFLDELETHPPDVILSDHGLPSFDGFTALSHAKERYPDTPFIFVTGAMGEAVAVESLKRGATDYVLKSQLSHLPPAIYRALREAEERASRKRAEAERDQLIKELNEALARIKTLAGVIPICALCKRIRNYANAWQDVEFFLQEHSEAAVTHELCPDCSRHMPSATPDAPA